MVLDDAEEIGLRHQHCGHFLAALGEHLLQGGAVGGAVGLRDGEQLYTVIAGVGIGHAAHVGRERFGHEHQIAAALCGHCHHDGFGRGGGAIIHRRVAHLHTGEAAHNGLILEDVLQGALRDFRLIGGVGREKFRARGYGAHGGRTVVLIEPGTGEAGTEGEVFVGQTVEIALHRGLIGALGEVVGLSQAQLRRHVGIKVVEALGAYSLQHSVYVGPGVGKIGIHSLRVGVVNVGSSGEER